MKPVLTLLAALAVGGSLVLIGCSKKEETSTPPAEPTAAAPAPGVADEKEPDRTAGESAGTALAEARQAMQKSDYETAADLLLRAEAAPMTEQQAFARIDQMRELSKRIADAAASGDPKAMRAAELMKRYQAMRTAAGTPR